MPTPLLANTLAASTYPLEIIQLQQWLDKNKDLKDKARRRRRQTTLGCECAIDGRYSGGCAGWRATFNGRPIWGMFSSPAIRRHGAVQRMRAKAQGTGNLKTSAQQGSETQAVEGDNR
jgi:hypothetical protein